MAELASNRSLAILKIRRFRAFRDSADLAGVSSCLVFCLCNRRRLFGRVRPEGCLRIRLQNLLAIIGHLAGFWIFQNVEFRRPLGRVCKRSYFGSTKDFEQCLAQRLLISIPVPRLIRKSGNRLLSLAFRHQVVAEEPIHFGASAWSMEQVVEPLVQEAWRLLGPRLGSVRSFGEIFPWRWTLHELESSLMVPILGFARP